MNKNNDYVDLGNGVKMLKEPVFGNDKKVMALTVLKKPVEESYSGLVRLVTERKGDPNYSGFLDKSKLYTAKSSDLTSWELQAELIINDIDEIIESFASPGFEYLGLEDPDIFEEGDVIHVFFTIAYKSNTVPHFAVHLGHAYGRSLMDLQATAPVLSPKNEHGRLGLGYKEASISPVEINHSRINLAETGCGTDKTSIVAVRSRNLGEPWELMEIVADPANMPLWAGKEVSPGPIFPPGFINHKGSLVGIVNGRSGTYLKQGGDYLGRFTAGLFIMKPDTGAIKWVSSEPVFDDPEAKGITFVSDFIETSKGEGLVFAHSDDAKVIAFQVSSHDLAKLLPK